MGRRDSQRVNFEESTLAESAVSIGALWKLVRARLDTFHFLRSGYHTIIRRNRHAKNDDAGKRETAPTFQQRLSSCFIARRIINVIDLVSPIVFTCRDSFSQITPNHLRNLTNEK